MLARPRGRRGGSVKGCICATALAVALALSGASAGQAALKRVAVARGLAPAHVVRADVRSRVLRTLQIEGTGAGVIKWRCSGPCRRTGGPPAKITHPHGATVLRHINVRLTAGTMLKLSVIVPSGQSHYLNVTAVRGRPVVSAAGCINAGGGHAPCTAPVTPPSSPAQTPAASIVPAVPTPVSPTNDPDGKLEQ